MERSGAHTTDERAWGLSPSMRERRKEEGGWACSPEARQGDPTKSWMSLGGRGVMMMARFLD